MIYNCQGKLMQYFLQINTQQSTSVLSYLCFPQATGQLAISFPFLELGPLQEMLQSGWCVSLPQP